MCWSKIKAYLQKRKYERELRELHEKIAQDIKKRQAGEQGLPIATSRGGPNMPVFQPCPECHASSQRLMKTEGGAYYRCRTHGEFFVKRSRGRRRKRLVHQHSK